MKNKEKRKWTIGLILVLVLILAVGAGRFIYALSNREIERELASLTTVATSEAKFVSEKLTHQMNVLDNISTLVVENGLNHENELVQTIRKAVEMNQFERIGIADEKGNAFTTDDTRINISDTSFFKQTMEGRPFMSEVLEIKGSHEEALIEATPIIEKGKVKGIVYGIVNTMKLTQDIDSSLNQDNQYIQIVDIAGNYVLKSHDTDYFADGTNIYEDLKAYEIEDDITLKDLQDKMKHRESGNFTYSYNDTKQYVHFTPLDIYGWYIFTITPSSVLNGNVGAVGVLVLELFAKVVLCFTMITIYIIHFYKKVNREIVTSHHQLREFSKILSVVLQKSQDNVFEYSPSKSKLKIYRGTHLKENKEYISITPFDIIEKNIIAPEFIDIFHEYMQEGIMQEHSELIMKVHLDDEEDYKWIKITSTGIFHDKEIVNIIGLIRDCSKEKEMELLYEQEKKYRTILIDNAIFSCEVDLQTDIVLSKDGMICEDEYILYSESVEETVRRRVHPTYKEDVIHYSSIEYLRTMFKKGQEQLKYEFMRKNDSGTYIWVEMIAHVYENEEGHMTALIVVNDINEQKEKELELSHKAQYDYLTNLLNREALVSKIDEYLSYPSSQNQYHALLLLDLDNFKEVNDNLGHDVGDQALKDVSEILKGKFRKGDYIGRLGGDEFVVFCKDINDPSFAKKVSSELVQALELTFQKHTKSVVLGASIGIAIAPLHGRTFDELYVKADEALYDVKRHHKNDWKVYEEE